MVESWQIGDITVTKVVEIDSVLSAREFFPNLDADRLQRATWTRDHYLDEDSCLGMSVHTFVVRTPDAVIVVDTCNGNAKPRSYETMSMLDLPFLERLEAAGCRAEDVDRVICTHLHFDHVGWNTRLVDGQWIPTFTNARYAFSRVEWDFWKDRPDAQEQFDSSVVLSDSVWALDEAIIDLVDDGAQLAPGVTVEAFAGHTPGHLCVWLRSGDQSAVITGDVLHSPIQFVDPSWHGRADVRLDESDRARQTFVDRVADTPTLVLGTHFPTPAAGYVRAEGSGWRFDPVEGGSPGRPSKD